MDLLGYPEKAAMSFPPKTCLKPQAPRSPDPTTILLALKKLPPKKVINSLSKLAAGNKKVFIPYRCWAERGLP